MYDSVWSQGLPPLSSALVQQAQAHLVEIPFPETMPRAVQEPDEARPVAKSGRGAPQQITWPHLWLGLLWSVLLGMENYQDLRRTVAREQLGSFGPVKLTSSALVKRLVQGGVPPLQQLFVLLSHWVAQRLTPTVVATTLASFATHIVALDETTLDALSRHLSWQRVLPKGHAALLPGKLAGLFDIRQQCWLTLQFRPEAQQNCKVDVISLLEGLPWRSLILFDLGYFSFAWFDYLTSMGYWWISRLREKTSYQLIHVYYRHHEILDALVWLGSKHGPHAGRAVRLVRFGDGKELRCYLSNVLDPRQLSMEDIARLYARRWDIELAFLTLKDYLNLHHWWSSKLVLVLQQIWAVLIIAHLLQSLRLEIAAQAGVDPFDVSLPLLVKYVPRWILRKQSLIDEVLTHGRDLGFIRPSSRLQVQVPCIPDEALIPAPADLILLRHARYVEYAPRPPRPSYNKKKRAKQKSSPSP